MGNTVQRGAIHAVVCSVVVVAPETATRASRLARF